MFAFRVTRNEEEEKKSAPNTDSLMFTIPTVAPSNPASLSYSNAGKQQVVAHHAALAREAGRLQHRVAPWRLVVGVVAAKHGLDQVQARVLGQRVQHPQVMGVRLHLEPFPAHVVFDRQLVDRAQEIRILEQDVLRQRVLAPFAVHLEHVDAVVPQEFHQPGDGRHEVPLRVFGCVDGPRGDVVEGDFPVQLRGVRHAGVERHALAPPVVGHCRVERMVLLDAVRVESAGPSGLELGAQPVLPVRHAHAHDLASLRVLRGEHLPAEFGEVVGCPVLQGFQSL